MTIFLLHMGLCMSLSHPKDTSSDHLAISLDFFVPRTPSHFQSPWVPPRPRLPKEDVFPDLALQIFDRWSKSHRGWDFLEMERFSALVLSMTG